MARVISATDAAQRLPRLLDEVEGKGEEFAIERHGRTVARLVPAGPVLGRATWGEVRRALLSVPRPDRGFAKDLASIRRRQGKLPPSPWERSSIPPSSSRARSAAVSRE